MPENLLKHKSIYCYGDNEHSNKYPGANNIFFQSKSF